MQRITKKYTSYELSKILNKYNFDIYSGNYYNLQKELVLLKSIKMNYIQAFEYYDVLDYILINYNIHVVYDVFGEGSDWYRWEYKIVDLNNKNTNLEYELNQLSKTYDILIQESYLTKFEAMEASIIEILNLIKK